MINQLIFRFAGILPSRLFWELLTPVFLKDPWQKKIFSQHWWLLNIIKAKKPHHVLEVGCGFGRNLQFFIANGIKPDKLTGVDFSSRLLLEAKDSLPKTVKLHRASVQHLPFPGANFDLVFTHGLLMHISHFQLTKIFQELIRVCRHWLVIIEETRIKPQKINPFTWAHDYLKLFKLFNLKIVDFRRDKHHLSWYLLQKT